MNQHLIALAAAAALGAGTTVAWAQPMAAPSANSPTSANTPTANLAPSDSSGVPASGTYGPKSVAVIDGVNVTPTLGVAFGHNDNVTQAPKGAARSSNVITLTPRLVANAAYRADRYNLTYQAEVVRYRSSSVDNVENQDLTATARNVLDTRLSVDTKLAFQDRFDPAGSTDRSIVSGRPDHWRGKNGAVLVRYGAPGARGRAEVELGVFDKRYVNNRATTQDADYLSTNAVARLGVRVAPKTSLLGEYRNTRFDYKRNAQNLDGTEQRYLIGAEWEATAATSGSFKVGYLNKSYKQVRRGFDGLTWEGAVSWSPRTYSIFDLSTGRSAADPTGNNGDYLRNAFVALNWTHEWSSFFSTRVSLAHNETAYAGTARRDKVDTIGLGANYDFRRWMRLGASYEFSTRNSTSAAFEYDRNVVNVFAEVGF